LSQAVVANGFVFTSGQVGKDPKGNLPETFQEQFDQALKNLEKLLTDAGSSLSQVVKITAYITEDGWKPSFNAIYGRYFTGSLPARTRVEVVRLSPGYLVELDAVAVVGSEAHNS
jgi:2-iminobutanoate/2-iminopropanoate deaminase